MRNLLDALQLEVKLGRLVGRELWLATDNSTAASAYFKGASGSRALHEMVTELRELTLKGNFILHIFHIAGTRMIQIGVDALSRGELHEGALAQAPESVAPLLQRLRMLLFSDRKRQGWWLHLLPPTQLGS
jgi:hypothetical protein